MLHPPTGRPRRLHWIALAGVAVSGMGLVAATAEWYVRRIVPIDWTQEYRVPHPVRGWALEPNARYTTYVPEPIRVAYNSEGWRDRERPKPAGSTPRVAVLGDSFVEAYSVQHDEAFSSRLERLAAASGRPLEVLNFGVGGYGTLQEYLTFTEAAREYRPRLVLLGFYLGNDVRNNDLALESVVSTGQAKVTSRPFLDPNRNSESDWALLPVDFERAMREYGAERARRERWPLRDARKSVLLRLAAGRSARYGAPGRSRPPSPTLAPLGSRSASISISASIRAISLASAFTSATSRARSPEPGRSPRASWPGCVMPQHPVARRWSSSPCRPSKRSTRTLGESHCRTPTMQAGSASTKLRDTRGWPASWRIWTSQRLTCCRRSGWRYKTGGRISSGAKGTGAQPDTRSPRSRS